MVTRFAKLTKRPVGEHFADFPAVAYMRKLEHQQLHRSRLLSHLYFFTFAHLQLDESLYAKVLAEHMQVWHMRDCLLKSPHALQRTQAAMLKSQFLKKHDELQSSRRLDL